MFSTLKTNTKPGSKRVLVVAPDVAGLPDLQPGAEYSELDALGTFGTTKTMTVDALTHRVIARKQRGNESTFSNTIASGRYHVIHLLTHGTQDHKIAFSDELVTHDDFAAMIGESPPELVIALICYSKPLAESLLRSGVKRCIVVDGPIDNEIARQFTIHFYINYDETGSADDALAFARSRVPKATNVMMYPQVTSADPMTRLADVYEELQRDIITHRSREEAMMSDIRAEIRNGFRQVVRVVSDLIRVLSDNGEDEHARPTD